MVASLQSLSPSTAPPTPLRAQTQGSPTEVDNLDFAIAYNLPPNYIQEGDQEQGYRWFCVNVRTSFKVEICREIEKRHINIAVLDNQGRKIKSWSTTLHMVGNWRRRLRRTASEAVILINQRPKCPACDLPMILCKRRKDKKQFFGCKNFPACNQSIIIVSRDIERPLTTTVWTTQEQREETYSLIAHNLPPNYRQLKDDKHGYEWFCQNQTTGLKAKVYADLGDAKIHLSLIDDRKAEIIKEWSSELQMISDWPSRLRRAAGEALVLVQQRPKCHICRSEMELRKRHQDERQFFGCSKYPNCIGTISITDHDVERTKAAS